MSHSHQENPYRTHENGWTVCDCQGGSAISLQRTQYSFTCTSMYFSTGPTLYGRRTRGLWICPSRTAVRFGKLGSVPSQRDRVIIGDLCTWHTSFKTDARTVRVECQTCTCTSSTTTVCTLNHTTCKQAGIQPSGGYSKLSLLHQDSMRTQTQAHQTQMRPGLRLPPNEL